MMGIEEYINSREWWKSSTPIALRGAMDTLVKRAIMNEDEAVDFVSAIVSAIREEYGE